MDITDVLRLDMRGFDEEYARISAILRKIGLTDYEARAYVALVARQHGTADEVAEVARIPRTSAYKALRSLQEKGFVEMAEGRPVLFHTVSSDAVRRRVMGELEDVFDKLESLRGVLSERGTPQLVFTISGRGRVLARIGEMLEASRRRFILSTSQMQAIRAAHSQKFKDAVKRGVELLIVAEPFVKVPASTRTYRKAGLIATDAIADGEAALIGAPDLSICGYSDNPFLAGHLESFMMMVLERSET